MHAKVFEKLAQRLEGRIVVLEPLGPEHVDGLRAAAADDRIWTWMVTRDVEQWISDALGEKDRQPFAILEDGVVVGSSSYMSLAPEHLRLEIGNTWMSPSTWGTGANVEAKYLLLRHAFEVVGCRRVEFKTDALNERARGALAATALRVRGHSPQTHARPGRRAARLCLVCRDRRRLARREASARGPALREVLTKPSLCRPSTLLAPKLRPQSHP